MSILIGETDAAERETLALQLRYAGYDVNTCGSFAEIVAAIPKSQPHLIFAAADLTPDAVEACRQIRLHTTVSLVMLAERENEEEQVRLLEAGADDYLVKPVRRATLVARTRALIRRAQDERARRPMMFGDLSLAHCERLLSVRNENPVALTACELRLVELLLAHGGRTVSQQNLIAHIWEGSRPGTPHALKQLIYRCRKKLSRTGATVRIVSAPAGGYRLEKTEHETAS